MEQHKSTIRGVRLLVSCLIFWAGVVFFGTYIYVLRIGKRDRNERKAQVLKKLQSLLELFQKIIKACNNINIRWINKQYAQMPHQIVVANHPTLIDALPIVCAFPDILCIYKKKLRRIPFLSAVLEELEYIPHDDGSFIEKALESIRNGKRLLIFPEGTRSGDIGLLPFHRGAATLANRAGGTLLPVLIKSSYPLLNKGIQWRATPEQIDIIFELCYPISPFEKGQQNSRMGEKELTMRLEEFYAKQLAQ